MGHHQLDAGSLARAVVDRARQKGCTVADEDPSVAELVLQCWKLGIIAADVVDRQEPDCA